VIPAKTAWAAFAVLALLLGACGPRIGDLQRGESGRVARAFDGDTLVLESGLRVFLAEVDAPSGEARYASQAQGELEALALHREVLLAYGGERRWVGRPREGETAPPPEAAIAHVYVRSEGGRWFWLQHELVSRGAAFVRPRRGNHARIPDLLRLEDRARAAQRGLWAGRDYRVLDARGAARLATRANTSCLRGDAPYRLIEGVVAEVQRDERRAAIILEQTQQPPFAMVIFGESLVAWDGPALDSLAGARVRARGALGVFRDAPQMCIDDARQIETMD